MKLILDSTHPGRVGDAARGGLRLSLPECSPPRLPAEEQVWTSLLTTLAIGIHACVGARRRVQTPHRRLAHEALLPPLFTVHVMGENTSCPCLHCRAAWHDVPYLQNPTTYNQRTKTHIMIP